MRYYQLVFDPVIGKHVSIYTDAGIMSALSNLADMTDDADVSGEWEVLQDTLAYHVHMALLPSEKTPDEETSRMSTSLLCSLLTVHQYRTYREWHIWGGPYPVHTQSLGVLCLFY